MIDDRNRTRGDLLGGRRKIGGHLEKGLVKEGGCNRVDLQGEGGVFVGM